MSPWAWLQRGPTTRTVGEHVGPLASLKIRSRLRLGLSPPPFTPPLLSFLFIVLNSLPFQSLLTVVLGFPSSSIKMSSRITDEEINELISKLQSLLPESRRQSTSRVRKQHHLETFLSEGSSDIYPGSFQFSKGTHHTAIVCSLHVHI